MQGEVVSRKREGVEQRRWQIGRKEVTKAEKRLIGEKDME